MVQDCANQPSQFFWRSRSLLTFSVVLRAPAIAKLLYAVTSRQEVRSCVCYQLESKRFCLSLGVAQQVATAAAPIEIGNAQDGCILQQESRCPHPRHGHPIQPSSLDLPMCAWGKRTFGTSPLPTSALPKQHGHFPPNQSHTLFRSIFSPKPA